MSFQRVINVTQAPGVAGDFASCNPRHSALSVPGGYVAGPNGVTVGLAVWADTATGTIVSNTGTGLPLGILHRNMQALITTYLGEFGMTIPAGMGVGDVFDNGDFFVVNAGASATTIGMKGYANLTNGTYSFAATGATVTGSIETPWICRTINAAGELVKISKTSIG